MGKYWEQMNLEQRIKLKKMLDSGYSVTYIAEDLGFCRATIYNEINRSGSKTNYDPYYAQLQYEEKEKNKGSKPKLSDVGLAKYISELILEQHLSPEKIVLLLAKSKNIFSNVPTSEKTIYSAIDAGLIPGVTRESLLKKNSSVFNNGQICIPKWVLDKLSIKNGDVLELELTEDGKIVYSKL